MQGFLNKVRLLEGIKCLDIVLSDEQIQMIDDYSALLYKWNKTYNLTSITNNDDVLTHHILDSLSAVPIFKRYVFEGAKVLDVVFLIERNSAIKSFVVFSCFLYFMYKVGNSSFNSSSVFVLANNSNLSFAFVATQLCKS